MPWATDGSQDTVPFQKIYERFRHPECHEYLFERDGMSNTVTSNAYWKKLLRAGVRHVRQARARPAPGDHPRAVRVPETNAEWLATDWAPNSIPYNLEQYRPPIADGAPGAKCPPLLVGATANGVDQDRDDASRRYAATSTDTWSRFNPATDKVTYLWLRDGAPLPLYNGAPIGSKPECECDAMSSREYVDPPQDTGHVLSVQVTAQNTEDSAHERGHRLGHRRDVVGGNLGGRNLSGVDFSGLNLTGTNLRGANLAAPTSRTRP